VSENHGSDFFRKNIRRFSGGQMDKDDFPQMVEREFVTVIARRADERGYGKGEFAVRMWPWMNPKIAATRWCSIREKAAHTGKPQIVSLADAQRMADAVGEELGYLVVVAKENVKKALRAAAQEEKQ
jgi:hypothetical protein